MLSKSKFVSGLQCEKRLWLQRHRADLIPALDEATKARFDVGNRVGDLAKLRFGSGFELQFPEDRNFEPMAQQTANYLLNDVITLYEAAIIEAGVLVLCDVLIKDKEHIICHEIKSSTKLKSYHIQDAAIQYFVLKKAGLEPERIYITMLNPEYFWDGQELNLEQLFKSHDVTDQVRGFQAQIPELLGSMLKILRNDDEPSVSIGPHCNNPFSCEFQNYCWPELPNPSVFSIPRIGNKAWVLFEEGKVGLEDLEPGDLSHKQQEYVQDQKEEIEKIDLLSIKGWLETLSFPLFFLDFETIMPALPLYAGTRPYQPHFAVQYSLHVLEEPEGELKHYEYLADFEADFRQELAASLIQLLGETGTILAYNQGFEKTCIKRLAEWCPDLETQLFSLLDRFKDLDVPFRKSWFVKPAMQGSYSIKSVYPALFPDSELQYKALTISNGEMAARQLLELAESGVNPHQEENKAVKQDLLAYCKLDTLAMVKIYQELLTQLRM